MRQIRLPAFGLLAVLLLAGCSKATAPSQAPPDAADVRAGYEGETIFQMRCFVCHGREGKGNGPASTGLGATVRDLTNPTWQNSTSDETIGSVIRNGAPAVGGSVAMVPNPDLTDAQIRSLVIYIRRLGR